jgi:hypothetical protein
MSKVPLGTRCKTGQICPESGEWKSNGSPCTTIPLAKGNRFPPYNNQAVT